MASYDCKECEYHNSYGNGKCKRFEYDCPFESLIKGKKRKEIEESIKEFRRILNRFKITEDWGEGYSVDQMYGIEYSINELEKCLNQDLYKEWLRISIGVIK